MKNYIVVFKDIAYGFFSTYEEAFDYGEFCWHGVAFTILEVRER